MTTSMILEQLKKAPRREYTEKEAQDNLKDIGILDSQNRIRKEFRDIIISLKSKHEQ